MDINGLFLLLFFISLGFAAFFCSAETAFIGMQKLLLQHLIQRGHPGARRAAKIIQEPEKFLATVLLGINFFETAVATLGTIVAVSLWGENVGVAVATIVITIVTLIFAELIPKSLAVRYGERLALRYVRPIEIVSIVFYPLTYVSNHIGIRFTKLVGEDGQPRPTISEEEFRSAINIGEAEGVVEGEEAEMLHKVFEFGDRVAREVATPRTEITWVEQGTKLADFFKIYRENPHSRFPMYKENRDNVVGILSIKDVLIAQASKSISEESTIDELIRPAYFVPETKLLGELLAEMRQNNQHMTVVVDEFGGVAGIITLEQLVEEIVGYIGDDLASDMKDFVTIDANTFEVDGGLGVDEANEELSFKLPAGEYQTVAGFILSHLGRIPKQGEQFKYHDLKFVISQMRGLKIEKIVVTKEKGQAPQKSDKDFQSKK